MVRRVLTSVLLALVPALAVPIAIAPAAPGGAAPPGSIQQCMNGGWQTLTDASGQPFTNQGLCIDFAIHHPVSLADLATSSFSGTTSLDGVDGCGVIFQTFDGSYPASGSVGTVNLHISGCVFLAFSYSGSFTITTSVGTLSGSASGPVSINLSNVPPGPYVYDLTLSVMNGTGSFAGTSGSLHVLITAQPPSLAVSGSVTPL
jgi:hypothetical protein